MNNVILLGRITKDIEMRIISETQMEVAKFSIAIDRPAAKGKEKQTDFINIVVFGKTAEACEKYTAKGKMIAIQGRIQTGSYKNKEGVNIYTTDVIADKVEFVQWKDKEEQIPEGFAAMDETDSDIPF